ncbi:TPA: trypsin-like peptidase domain-containing protein [Streptococcus pneumoniae]|jgi:choline binding protein G|uniref:Serine protease n=8 Tax=Streptococcus pneumoniae TaxID=1313 RepID=A0A0T8C175_STREE|nr:trypsin-like peptidase domain-containing protein [Streptococcus pneumoniae]EHZ12730.1 peptidase C4 family protein [Streptococcus pneumoniae GA05248]EHZ81657.1 peptidase C4 family protein [Streptococcus pneumoniae 8190-05]EHZ89761.1 peptidase C4 family protein [Streptococcus pneumoniae 4075-00]EIA00853.1 peptidase C4 family protein [Streptococcus pneumoniae GA05578]EJG95619.1 choline binding protein G [Streptococcus pneumoniae GA04216]EPD19925.1 choline binding protein G [Streptococcus pneu
MKKTFYKKLGISIIASTLLASQLSTVSALTVISSTGEEYEVSETLQKSPGTNNLSLPEISPTYGQYYTNQSEVIIGKNDLVKVKNTLQYPYSTSAYVKATFKIKNADSVEIGTGRGSASFIKDNVLITAAHVVYDRESKTEATEVEIMPAATPDSNPFGEIKVKEVRYLKEFRNTAPNELTTYDLAVLILEEPIGAQLGTLGLPNNLENTKNLDVTVTGYSAVNKGIKQMYTDTKTILQDTNDFLFYQIDTKGGASGSAVYDSNNRIVGVHTNGSDPEQMNYAVKLNEKALSFIYSVIKGHSIDGWKLISDTWYYYKNSNKQTGWQKINDTWYYLDASGKMLTDWQKVNGKWYYFGSSGSMATSWKYVGGRWYYFDKTNGDMKTGWYKDGSTWYYLDPTNGDMKKGWIKVGGNWYYLNSSGAMVTGSQTIDGKVYNFASSGEWI